MVFWYTMFKECEHQRVLLASRFVVWSSFHFRQLCLPWHPSQASPSLALRACFCIWGPFCKDPTMTWLEYHVVELHFPWFWNLALFFSGTTFTALMFHVLVFRSVIIGLYTWLEYHVVELHFLWFWNLALFFSGTTFTALMFHVLVFRLVIIGLYKNTFHLTYLDNVLNESKTLCLFDFIFPWMDSTLTFVRSLQWQLFTVKALGWFRPHCVNPLRAKFSQ